MSLERGKMIATISPDGLKVELEVKNVKGKSCLDLTKAIEEALGELDGDRQLTEEYHQRGQTTQHQSLRG
jgi:hypothetical protein